MFKPGKWTKNNTCQCGKKINPGTTYCRQCCSDRMRRRQLGKNNVMHRLEVKLKQGQTRRNRHCPVPSRRGSKWSLSARLAISKRNRSIEIHTHHLDQTPQNNIPSNKLKIPKGIHASIHQQAYKFIYDKGLLQEYFTWLIPYLGVDLNREIEKQKSGV